MKKNLLSDAKQLWFDFRNIYPSSFYWITSHWQISTVIILLIFSSFTIDDALRIIIQGSGSGFWDSVFSFGRWYGSGEPTLILFVVMYLFGLFGNQKEIREGGLLIGESYVFAGLVTLIFKSVCGRMRPYTGQGDMMFEGWSLTSNDQFSFFSGHATVAFALSASLASMTTYKPLKYFFLLIAFVCAISRIYHNQHWFSDVFTGSVIALLIMRNLIILKNSKSKILF